MGEFNPIRYRRLYLALKPPETELFTIQATSKNRSRIFHFRLQAIITVVYSSVKIVTEQDSCVQSKLTLYERSFDRTGKYSVRVCHVVYRHIVQI